MSFDYKSHLEGEELEVLTRQEGELRYTLDQRCSCGKCLEKDRQINLFRCFYCNVFFCADCMAGHLGESREAWYHKKKS